MRDILTHSATLMLTKCLVVKQYTISVCHVIGILGPDFTIRMADIRRMKRMFSGWDRFSQ